MRLSVVIVNWNTRNLLERCLESVALGLSDFANGEVETWVVDNASIDGSADLVRQRFPLGSTNGKLRECWFFPR